MSASPLISVILAAHDPNGSLDDCLQSILNQSFTEVEVILVRDQAAECPADQVDAWARREDRVSVVRLDGLASIGRIRNAGAERATGDYLLFLDADHLLLSSTLQAMADRLDEAYRPDVLLFGHTRLHQGKSWPGAAADLLARQRSQPFAPVQQPELFGAPAYSWDRLFRRAYWTAQRLAFPDGLHEEVATVHRAMLGAEQIAVLKWDCVQLRRRLTQHPAGSPEGSQFDVFDRYEESFGLLAEHVQLDGVKPYLFTRMVRQYLFLLNLSGAVPRGDRSRFFQRASEHYGRYLPEGYERPEGREGVKFQLVGGGKYAAFEAAKLPALFSRGR
ncbi:glycosyltransferase [Kitasatospora sp. MMS16-BH015]|uniref:glycosyltransferase family 2 protein n=1 Tax=Kitasatospora sp. MMS16-BH015 TaxID=2018025 RepID=UPI00131A4CB3|nr:glycosyltransferase [Kitasatospora sp. MMS16-BH015]